MPHNENESYIEDDEQDNTDDRNNPNNYVNNITDDGEDNNNGNNFTDIRLSSSNNKTKSLRNSSNNTSTTTTTASSNNNNNSQVHEIELDDLGQQQHQSSSNQRSSGIILTNDNTHQDEENEDKIRILDPNEDDDDNSDKSETSPPPPIPRHIWIRVIVIYFAVFCDGLSLTLIQPFLPQLLTKKWGYPEEDEGYLSGLLVGVYSFARFGSGFYLGHFSDKYGRKPFLVMSLFATGVGTVIFSNMPNVWFAIGLRMLEGLFSNTTALCQATLADMVDKRNRASVFAYLGSTYALSRCISSSLGGFVVKLFQDTPNPYFYACLIGGVIVLLSALLVFIMHPETHPKYTKLDYSHHYQQLKNDKNNNGDNSSENDGKTNEDKKPTNVDGNVSFKDGIKIILKDRAVVLLMVIGGLNSYCNGGLLLSLVLFSALSVEKKGLGFEPSGSGFIFTILGFFGFVWQVTLFKKLSLSFGLKRQFTMGMILLCIGMALFPLTYIGLVKEGNVMVWIIIFISVPIISVGFMNGLPLVGAMIGTVCKPEIQGLTQGATQSINSMLRSFGPALSGALFSWSSNRGVPWLLFIILSSIYVIIAVISLYLPDKVDANHSVIAHKRKLKKNQKEEKQSLTTKV